MSSWTNEVKAFGATSETSSGRWVDYAFFNPATDSEGIKRSWVVRHDGLLIGSGWYE